MNQKLYPSLIFLSLLLLVSNAATSQLSPPLFTAKNYGGSNGDEGRQIKNTPDGGHIMIGTTNSNDHDVSGLHGVRTDFWVVKLDKNGAIQWQKTYENTFDEDAQSIILTSDGGYALCGTANPYTGTDDVIIFKISGTGVLQWQKQIGGTGADMGRQIAETPDGGFVITGTTSGTANGDFTGQTNHGGIDLFVAKLNSSGTLLWTKIYGGSRDEEGRFIRQLSDGNILVGGEAASIDGDVTGNHSTLLRPDFWILKLTPTGTVIWKKCYGSTGLESAYNAFEKGNRYYVVGETVTTTNAGDVSGLHDQNEIWMVVLDASGNLVRQKIIGGTGFIDKGRDIAPTLDNNIIIGGFVEASDGDFDGGNGNEDFALIKLDTLGNILWTKKYGGPFYDPAYSLAVNADSSYSLLGSTQTPGGDVAQGLTVILLLFMRSDQK
jgi:hypothetical protein